MIYSPMKFSLCSVLATVCLLMPCVRFMSLALLLFAVSAVAQPAATGIIEGRVTHLRTGDPVERARVTVESTTLETFTDSSGLFRLTQVPTGTASVRVFFTGQAQQTVLVTVAPREIARRDFSLSSSPLPPAPAADASIVKLDQFVVSSSKEMDAAAIAINEQRFAASIKSVVSADEFGSVLESNPGDFLKYIPGITIDFIGGAARSISIGGVPPNTCPSPSAASMSPASPAAALRAAWIFTLSR